AATRPAPPGTICTAEGDAVCVAACVAACAAATCDAFTAADASPTSPATTRSPPTAQLRFPNDTDMGVPSRGLAARTRGNRAPSQRRCPSRPRTLAGGSRRHRFVCGGHVEGRRRFLRLLQIRPQRVMADVQDSRRLAFV